MISASSSRQQLLHSVQHWCHPFPGAPHFHCARMAAWQERIPSNCLTVERKLGFPTPTALVNHELAMIAYKATSAGCTRPWRMPGVSLLV